LSAPTATPTTRAPQKPNMSVTRLEPACAHQVHGHDILPVGLRRADDVANGTNTCVVAQHIDSSVLGDHGSDESATCLVVGDVQTGLDIDADDRVAVLLETSAEFCADAPRRSRHDDDAAIRGRRLSIRRFHDQLLHL